MKYSAKPTQPPNLCRECGEQVRRPKSFCDDNCRQLYMLGKGFVPDHRGTAQIAQQRRERGITAESLEWRRKRNAQQPF